jgi:serine/threonine protein kinase
MAHNKLARKEKRTVQPRVDTPVRGGPASGGKLPDDILNEQTERLALLAAVGGVLWSIGLFLDAVVVPLRFHAPRPTMAVNLEILAVCVSLLTFVYMRRSNHSAATKTDVGLAYMIFSSFAVALPNTWTTGALQQSLGHLSWITIIILVSSMITVTTPMKVLAASLVAASMDPLTIWIAHLRGLPVPSPLDTFILCQANYSCAFVALLPSRVLRRMGHHLREAREMGSYRLVELLGHGGMGEVWRAEHRLLARSAAIKLVRPEVLGASNDDDVKLALRRFEREAQATAALSSPHTIRLFDFGVTSEGAFYYVMELLAGRDLQSLVAEFGPLPAERVVFLLRQVCHSLADAHARGLVHRDIKPANIYACRMGLEYDFIKVLDFGLVKFRQGDADVGQTLLSGDHPTTGTPAYMAPEIILGAADVDRRADVYALGCVAYFLLTGHLVFEGDTSMKVLVQHIQSVPIPPSERTELPIPRELDNLVLACLEKDPNKRPQDAEQLYRLAYGCHSCDRWTSDAAKVWWERHLPEFTGPLTLTDPKTDAARVVAVS